MDLFINCKVGFRKFINLMFELRVFVNHFKVYFGKLFIIWKVYFVDGNPLTAGTKRNHHRNS